MVREKGILDLIEKEKLEFFTPSRELVSYESKLDFPNIQLPNIKIDRNRSERLKKE